MWTEPNWGARFQAIWRSIRNHPMRWTGVLIVVALLLMPVWPYRAHCGNWANYADFHTIEGRMTPEFLEAMSISLWREHVIHARIGNRIYLPIPSVLNIEISFRGSGVRAAQHRAISGLVTPPINIYSLAGKELLGKIYEPATHLTELYNQDESLVFGDDCVFVRAVAFGEPPPPGYAPEPSLFESAPASD
jgi:hypothetical protein